MSLLVYNNYYYYYKGGFCSLCQGDAYVRSVHGDTFTMTV